MRISRANSRDGLRRVGGEQRRVAGDDHEHVVEVVGDGARREPDRFHLLSLPHLCLQQLAGADVARMDDADAAAGAVGLEPPDRLERAPQPVGVPQPVLDRRRRRVVLAALVEGAARTRGMSSGWTNSKRLRPIELVGTVAEMLLGRRALVDDGAELVDHRDDVERALGERAVEAMVAGRVGWPASSAALPNSSWRSFGQPAVVAARVVERWRARWGVDCRASGGSQHVVRPSRPVKARARAVSERSTRCAELS